MLPAASIPMTLILFVPPAKLVIVQFHIPLKVLPVSETTPPSLLWSSVHTIAVTPLKLSEYVPESEIVLWLVEYVCDAGVAIVTTGGVTSNVKVVEVLLSGLWLPAPSSSQTETGSLPSDNGSTTGRGLNAGRG